MQKISNNITLEGHEVNFCYLNQNYCFQDNENKTTYRCYRYLSHAAHDAKLLCADEALQHDADGHVDIIFIDIVTQVHTSMCFSHADHGLNVPNSDRNAACSLVSKAKAYSA